MASGPEDPLKAHYEAIGFDPLTMDQADMQRLLKEADERWRASIPGTPLTAREKKTLAQFGELPPGEVIGWRQIKGCGPDTQDRLEARGFIEVRWKGPDMVDAYVLTAQGKEAARSL